jgi:hypothetical protein
MYLRYMLAKLRFSYCATRENLVALHTKVFAAVHLSFVIELLMPTI